jgi:hypothetical protein
MTNETKSRFWPRVFLTAAFLTTAVVTWLLATIWYHMSNAPPLPALLQAVPIPKFPYDSKEFTQLLLKRFPLGSPEHDLIRELWQEGFQPGPNWTMSKMQASFDSQGICRIQSNVDWTADNMGHLTSLRGDYEETCL